jgi:hypothetical protein
VNCPTDNHPLREKEVHGVEVTVCDECGGMLLDHGELNRVAEPTAGDLEFSTLDGDTFQHTDDRPPIACPRDAGAVMKKVEFNIYSNIILDYCDRCRSFWLEGKELVRINEEIRELNEAAREVPDPPMLWFAKFIWSLPFPH